MNVLVAVADLGLRALWEGILHDHGHRTLPVSADLPEWHEAHTFALDIAIVELTPTHPEALELCRRLRTGSPESGPALIVLVQPAEATAMLVSLGTTPDNVVLGHPDRRTAMTHLAAIERNRAAPMPGAGFPLLPPAPRPATILLIDDEPSVRHPLRMALQHAGYRVIEACDGEEGLEVIASRGDELALVLADQRMRRISGLEILRQVRRRPRWIPVVLMSGYPSLEPPDGMEGPDAYLRKPFELLDLARTVQRLVGGD